MYVCACRVGCCSVENEKSYQLLGLVLKGAAAAKRRHKVYKLKLMTICKMLISCILPLSVIDLIE